MATSDPDMDALEAVPENLPVLAALRPRAEPARSEYRLGSFELHTHPDLCERLEQVAQGGRAVGVYGLCARAGRGGAVFAIGIGTGSIALRLPDGPAREAVLANGGRLEPAFGPGWVVADAWLSEVPRAAGTSLLADWVEAARVGVDA